MSRGLTYALLIVGAGLLVVHWMKGKAASTTVTPTANDPLGIGQLQLQPWFTTTIGAQPGTTAFPSQLQ